VTKELAMANAATAAKQYIENSARADFYDLAEELGVYLEFAENSFIFVTDTEGSIIINTPLPANYLKKDYISESLMREVLDSLRHYRFHTLDGLFAAGHQIFPQYLNNGDDILRRFILLFAVDDEQPVRQRGYKNYYYNMPVDPCSHNGNNLFNDGKSNLARARDEQSREKLRYRQV
jgi:hypothetical protein